MNEKAFLSQLVDQSHLSSEFNRFVNAQYEHFPQYLQKIVLGMAYHFSSNNIERMENRIEQFPEHFSGDTRNEKRRNYIEKRHLNKLVLFERHIDGDDKIYYEYLLGKYQKPERQQETIKVTTVWGPTSPIELDELSKKTIPDVIQYLLDYVPSENSSIEES